MLSNQKKRDLYDSVGHEAFLNDVASVDPMDESSEVFSVTFADLFHDTNVDPFVEEPYFHWSFQQTGEDVGTAFQYSGIEDPVFSIYFADDNKGDDLF